MERLSSKTAIEVAFYSEQDKYIQVLIKLYIPSIINIGGDTMEFISIGKFAKMLPPATLRRMHESGEVNNNANSNKDKT